MHCWILLLLVSVVAGKWWETFPVVPGCDNAPWSETTISDRCGEVWREAIGYDDNDFGMRQVTESMVHGLRPPADSNVTSVGMARGVYTTVRYQLMAGTQPDAISGTRQICSAWHQYQSNMFKIVEPFNCTLPSAFPKLYRPDLALLAIESGIAECIQWTNLMQQIVRYNGKHCDA